MDASALTLGMIEDVAAAAGLDPFDLLLRVAIAGAIDHGLPVEPQGTH